jgi:ABC-type sulfate transport system substrate-binding protein
LPNPNNENTTEPLTIPHNVDIVQRRHIQTDVHNSKSPRYHVVTWDVRNPTPGVKEWLDMIQPGDVIGVYPRTKGNWPNYVEMIEVEVYCEF